MHNQITDTANDVVMRVAQEVDEEFSGMFVSCIWFNITEAYTQNGWLSFLNVSVISCQRLQEFNNTKQLLYKALFIFWVV